jgi:cytoskeletal protein CcmA (bactofilin family)
MLQSAPSLAPKFPAAAPTPNPSTPTRTVSTTAEQATIGRSIVIKGEVSGSEPLYVDGRIEGKIQLSEQRVTVGRNGVVAASISAREVVIMGKVEGNVNCTERVDIRAEGSLTGDVVSPRISVEDGAILKGSIQVSETQQKNSAHKTEKYQETPKAESKQETNEAPKALAASAGA